MSLPLVAVTTDLKHVAPYDWHATPSPYVDAVVAAAGALPVLVPSLAERLDIDALLSRIDGLLVTGSRSNVHPNHYGARETEGHAPFDPARDATTLPLIRAAIARGVPVLAICRGIQEMNVAFGGTLTAQFQAARELPDHGYPWEGTLDERFSLAHDAHVAEGSCLAGILGPGPVRVNSLHTQALDRPGDGLVVEATAPDGTIEAVSVPGAPGFAVGVQWHPEYWAKGSAPDADEPSNRILAAFGEAARAYASQRGAMPQAAE